MDRDEIQGHIEYQVRNAKILSWPFPHIAVSDFLPWSFFQALETESGNFITRQRKTDHVEGAYFEKRFSQIFDEAMRRDLPPENPFSVLMEILDSNSIRNMFLEKFRMVIEARFVDRPQVAYSSFELVEDQSGYALPPHTDSPTKLITGLLYMPDPDMTPGQGTSLYLPKTGTTLPDTGWQPGANHFKRPFFTRVISVPFERNLFLGFAPMHNTLHGVEEVEGGPVSRRLIQFGILGEGRLRERTGG